MKILFTHSYFLKFDPKQLAHGQPYPPLGTIWAAALLRQHGFDVLLFDTMFADNPNEIIVVLDKYKPDVLVVYDDGFNFLTKMCLTNMREAAFVMQNIAKHYGCQVIITSSDAADNYEKYLNNGADFVIIGEAEYTLLELIKELNEIKPHITKINGLVYLIDKEPHKNIKRTASKKLDELPLPAWDLVDIYPYKEMWLKKHGYFSINIATTRGCPFKCNWCAKPMYGNEYNMRSATNVVKEITLLKQFFNMDHIWFCDDIFGLKRSWVQEFAELVNDGGVKTAYKIQSRADLLVEEKYVTFLELSGCKEVWMGAESGSQKILDAMDKGITVEQIKEARKLLKQYNIKAAFFLQYGYLGETLTDIYKTIDLLKETMPDDIGISVSYPLPGTKFYNNIKQSLILKSNWTDSDDLDLMFKNTYPSTFYKKLHRYTHYIFRFQKLKNDFIFSPVYYCKVIKYFLLKQYYKRKLNVYTNAI